MAGKGFADLIRKAAEQRKAQHDDINKKINEVTSVAHADYHTNTHPDTQAGYQANYQTSKKLSGELPGELSGEVSAPLLNHQADYQADTQANYQTSNHQADTHSNTQADYQADTHSNTQADYQADTHSNTQADYQADTHSNTQADYQADTHSNTQADYQADTHSNTQADYQADTHSNTQADYQANIIKINNLSYLTKNQTTVFLFLVSNKDKPTSYKIISENTGVKQFTVRDIVRVLVENKVITQPVLYRRGKIQGFTYTFYRKINLEVNYQADYQTPENSPPLIKKERKSYFLNLSISDFWTEQGLTQQKLNTWIEEFDFTKDEWEDQLMFGENEPKVQTAKSPINYFYKSLKAGGLTRPKGFEFPEERRLRIQAENLKDRQKILEITKKLKQQEQEMAEEEAFNAFLEDKEAMEATLKDIEKGYLTPKAKNTIKIYREKNLMDKTLRSKLLAHFRAQE